MRKRIGDTEGRRSARVAVMSVIAGTLLANSVPLMAQAAVENGWKEENGGKYWYENGVKQGLEGRGKEIYDPDSDAWYWLDSVQDGAMAVSKDVYQESEAGEWGDFVNDEGKRCGKWVRYDENGHMIKGWYSNENGTYYFDLVYGTMAKGAAVIDAVEYYFNDVTGILESGDAGVENGWATINGNEYWYENGVRQGYDSTDAGYRGKEIYDPASAAWYWLDNVDLGKKATSKDVFQESQADAAGNMGKWVRYDAEGHMIKGWNTNEDGTYYFDPVYGTMTKGSLEIDGVDYVFDVDSGVALSGHRNRETDFVPTPFQVYCDMMAMQEEYPEGTEWTNDNAYKFNVPVRGVYYTGRGCAGFAFLISDAAFGHMPAYQHTDFDNIKVGDILRVNHDTHSSIVLEVLEDRLIVADGNWIGGTNGIVHWGREVSRSEVRETGSYVITRYIPTEDENFIVYSGRMGEINWEIDAGGKLLVTGNCGEQQTDGWYERGRHYPGWYYYREAIKSAVVEVKNATNLKGLLGSLYNLESADLSRLDTSQVTDMSDMFRGCAKLAELDLSNFDTSKVTDMSWMFNSCDNLTELNLSSFDTSQVTNMTGMFNCSPKLQNIYVGSGWVIGEGTAAKNMFTACGTDHVTLQQ